MSHHQTHLSAVVDKQAVLRLEVAVYDALLVQVRHGIRDAVPYLQHLCMRFSLGFRYIGLV